MQRIHIGGNAAVRYMAGQPQAQLDRNGGFMVNQAGIVIDADVAPNLSFWYDLDAIREGVARDNTFFPVQQVYARVDNILDQSWLNVKLGRAFMPFGEEYLQWDSIDNPL